jgi:hypothetical protein
MFFVLVHCLLAQGRVMRFKTKRPTPVCSHAEHGQLIHEMKAVIDSSSLSSIPVQMRRFHSMWLYKQRPWMWFSRPLRRAFVYIFNQVSLSILLLFSPQNATLIQFQTHQIRQLKLRTHVHSNPKQQKCLPQFRFPKQTWAVPKVPPPLAPSCKQLPRNGRYSPSTVNLMRLTTGYKVEEGMARAL